MFLLLDVNIYLFVGSPKTGVRCDWCTFAACCIRMKCQKYVGNKLHNAAFLAVSSNQRKALAVTRK